MARLCKFYRECHQPAVYQIPHSKLALCKTHFLENVEKRVGNLIEKKHMFHPHRDERVLVAASGGKDSQVLLSIIKELYPEGLEVEALYIELGIGADDYSQDSGQIAHDYCEKLGVPFHSISIKQDYGMSIDDLHHLKEAYEGANWQRDVRNYRGECSHCGKFKRHTINKFAAEHGLTAVATGHNLTDEATAMFNNFLNQKLMFLARPGPKTDSELPGLVPRVKPLFYISEEEIMMYAYFKGVPFLPTECPYAAQSPLQQLKAQLLEIEGYRRGNMIAFMRGYYKKLQPVFAEAHRAQLPPGPAEHKCKSCGGPTFSDTCSFCKNLRYLHRKFAKVEHKLHHKIL